VPVSDRPDGGRAPLRRGVGELEAEILAVLRAAGEPLSPGEVRERLQLRDGRELSYSTVVTIVSRLHTKGLLSRQRSGRGFVYKPVDQASLAAGRMNVALAAGEDHSAVLSRFVSGLSDRDARLLRELLGADDQPDIGPPGAGH
jgi:predicted transcriptional regulator